MLSVLGRGAMGMVFLAEQLDHDGETLREVALKTILPSEHGDAEVATQMGQRFLREIRIAARLSSPHTVIVHDSGKTDEGELYFSMELVRGDTLRQLIARHGPLGAERAAGIAIQICEALAEAHAGEQPIVHRDLKPGNIFVQHRDGRDWVKVSDFGIAKLLGADSSGLTGTGLSPGTPLYMSPEQWRGGAIDACSDLYALGVILHEMLHGEPPFDGEPHVLMYKHLDEAPPPLSDAVPEALRKIVALLLEKDPWERPQSASDVRRALEQAVEGGSADDATEIALAGSRRDDATRRDERATATIPVAPEAQAGRTITMPGRSADSSTRSQPVAMPAASPARSQVIPAAIGVAAVAALVWLVASRLTGLTSPEPVVEMPVMRRPTTPVATARPPEPPPTVAPSPVPTADAASERRDRLKRLLAMADANMSRRRFTTPPGDNATELYEQALRLDPRNDDALAGLRRIEREYIRRSDEALRRDDIAGAEAELAKAVRVSPESVEVQDALRAVARRKEELRIAAFTPTPTATPQPTATRPPAPPTMPPLPPGGCDLRIDPECRGPGGRPDGEEGPGGFRGRPPGGFGGPLRPPR